MVSFEVTDAGVLEHAVLPVLALAAYVAQHWCQPMLCKRLHMSMSHIAGSVQLCIAWRCCYELLTHHRLVRAALMVHPLCEWRACRHAGALMLTWLLTGVLKCWPVLDELQREA